MACAGVLLVWFFYFYGNKKYQKTITFGVTLDEEGYLASCFTESIITEADTIVQLEKRIPDAVLCHFEEEDLPGFIEIKFCDPVFQPHNVCFALKVDNGLFYYIALA